MFNKIGMRFGNSYLSRVPGVKRTYYTLKRLVAGSDRFTEYHGVQVYVDPVDEIGGRIICEEHEPDTVQLIRDLLSEGSTFVDVGAHYGAMTAIGADIVGPAGNVIAIEPNPKSRRYLKRTIDSNDFHNRVDVVPIAVGADSGETSLYIPKSSGRTHTDARTATNRTTSSEKVKQSTIHKIIKRKNIENALVA
jgi:FkbM family methyltransferase